MNNALTKKSINRIASNGAFHHTHTPLPASLTGSMYDFPTINASIRRIKPFLKSPQNNKPAICRPKKIQTLNEREPGLYIEEPTRHRVVIPVNEPYPGGRYMAMKKPVMVLGVHHVF